MREKGDFLIRHKNLLIVLLLLVTMTVSSLANQERLAEEAATVSLPLTEPSDVPLGKLEQFRQQRDAESLRDMAALQSLIAQEELDSQTREAAAAQLRDLVDVREKQLALEGALLESGMYPCVAVVSAGHVTLVTEKADLSDDENTLLLTMAQLHASAPPNAVSVMTVNETRSSAIN